MGTTNCVNGDIATGTCYSHKSPRSVNGPVATTQTLCTISGLPAVVEGDIVSFNCGHTGICVATASITKIQGKKVVRDGDPVTAGSGNVVATIHSTQNICTSK